MIHRLLARPETGAAALRVPSYRISAALLLLFHFGVFFPYIKTLPLGSDTQPLALIIAFLLVLSAKGLRVPRAIALLVYPFLAGLVLILASDVNLYSFRNAGNYASCFFIAAATYLVCKANSRASRVFLEYSIYIWFLVGLIQTVFNRDFLTGILSAARTSETRGVVGLGPEPTTYAVQCLLFMLLATYMFEGRKRALLLGLSVVSIILFAQSSMGVLLLVVWGALYVIMNAFSIRRAGVVLAILLTVVLGYRGLVSAPNSPLAETRLAALANLFLSNPSYVFLRDESANARVSAIVLSVSGSVENGFVPRGFSAMEGYAADAVARFSRYVELSDSGNRIMSGYGAALFELGFIGVLIPLVITWALFRYHRGDWRGFLINAVFLHAVLFSAIPLALPLIGFIVGYLCYHAPARATLGPVSVGRSRAVAGGMGELT